MRSPKIEEYQEQQMKLERKWTEIRTNLSRSESLEDDLEKVSAGLATIQSRLIDPEDVASNYEFFYDLERSSGVKLERVSLGLPSDGRDLSLGDVTMANFAVVTCEIVMTGTIREILAFIDRLDRNDFIIRMDLLNVVKTGSLETGSIDEDLNAQLRCYVLASKDE